MSPRTYLIDPFSVTEERLRSRGIEPFFDESEGGTRVGIELDQFPTQVKAQVEECIADWLRPFLPPGADIIKISLGPVYVETELSKDRRWTKTTRV